MTFFNSFVQETVRQIDYFNGLALLWVFYVTNFTSINGSNYTTVMNIYSTSTIFVKIYDLHLFQSSQTPQKIRLGLQVSSLLRLFLGTVSWVSIVYIYISLKANTENKFAVIFPDPVTRMCVCFGIAPLSPYIVILPAYIIMYCMHALIAFCNTVFYKMIK